MVDELFLSLKSLSKFSGDAILSFSILNSMLDWSHTLKERICSSRIDHILEGLNSVGK